MASPIETNTEELQEILQQVYDLPNRNAGGGSEPDLIIGTNYNTFSFNIAPTVSDITFDQSKVAATYQKLRAGESVDVVMLGTVNFYSGGGDTGIVVKASNVFAFSDGHLRVCFVYISGINSSDVAGHNVYVLDFDVDTENGTATASDIRMGDI